MHIEVTGLGGEIRTVSLSDLALEHVPPNYNAYQAIFENGKKFWFISKNEYDRLKKILIDGEKDKVSAKKKYISFVFKSTNYGTGIARADGGAKTILISKIKELRFNSFSSCDATPYSIILGSEPGEHQWQEYYLLKEEYERINNILLSIENSVIDKEELKNIWEKDISNIDGIEI